MSMTTALKSIVSGGKIMGFHMPTEVGLWYKNRETGDIFEIVASDEDDGYVEIQYFAGEIEEIDLETWYELELIEIPEPEDWSGPFELTKEDIDYSDNPLHPENWSGPLAGIEPDAEDWY